MTVAVSGGLGFEEDLIEALRGYPVRLLGGGYDLSKEKFLPSSASEFMGESLTHRWAEWFSASEMYFDVSDFSLSKYILNDFSLNDNKPALILFFSCACQYELGLIIFPLDNRTFVLL